MMTATTYRVDNPVDEIPMEDLSREELSYYSFGGEKYPDRDYEYDRYDLSLEVQEYNRRNRTNRLTQLTVEAIRDLILDHCESNKVIFVGDLSNRKQKDLLKEIRLITGFCLGTPEKVTSIIAEECEANSQESVQGLCAEQTVRMIGELLIEVRGLSE